MILFVFATQVFGSSFNSRMGIFSSTAPTNLYVYGGRKSSSMLHFFLQILPNLHRLHPLQFVAILVSMAQLVASSVYHAVDSGFESHLRMMFLREQ